MTDGRRNHHRLPAKSTQVRGERPKSASRVSPARIAAFQILSRVGRGRGHSDDLLHSTAVNKLSSEDRNLTTALVLGTLRWQIALDARVRALLQRPDEPVAEPVMITLRLGAFQLLHLDRIPPHAAINESVELARTSGHAHASGLVNAVLRKLSTAPKSAKKLHESTASFAERLAHPLWLVEGWVKNYGRDAALEICEFDQQEPGCGNVFSSMSNPDACTAMPVMDNGSRLVGEIAAVALPAPTSIWDCCAAPGGKTLVMAHRHPKAALLATDASAKRLLALDERLKREAPNALSRTLVAEAQALPDEEKDFDLILCDVPCSGTGTLARNPEIKHLLRVEDLPRQGERQYSILRAALERLSDSGRLIYSTCSLEPEENEQVVEAVLQDARGKFRVLPLGPLLDDLRARRILSSEVDLQNSVRKGFLRTLPGYSFQGDGFFAAVFAKL